MTRNHLRTSAVHRLPVLVLGALYLSSLVATVSAQPAPVGDELQINTYTTGDQSFPSVAVEPDGDFVVVWESFGSSGSDNDERSIQGQRYDANGNPVGGQFQVNSYVTSFQIRPAVAVDSSGNAVVVWTSNGSSGPDTDFSIQGQRYDAAGNPAGGEFQVNSYTTSIQRSASVAGTNDGFVVVWESFGSSGGDNDGSSVQGQRYDSDGNPAGSQFQINSSTPYGQGSPAVAADADGNFVVVWSTDDPVSLSATWGRRFAADGTALGGDFVVSALSGPPEYSPSVAVDPDGNFVVVWSGFFDYIEARRFASDGAPIGSDFQVDSSSPGYGMVMSPSVAVNPGGDFVVVWGSGVASYPGPDGSASSIQGRRFSSGGEAIGGEFQANTFTTGDQRSPSVSAASSGHFVVVWQSEGSSGTDTDGDSIQGQRFEVELFADGFESGDTLAWSHTVP